MAEISNKVIIHPLLGQPPPAGAPDPEDLRRLYNAWCGLSSVADHEGQYPARRGSNA
jgi:hypothetical protein